MHARRLLLLAAVALAAGFTLTMVGGGGSEAGPPRDDTASASQAEAAGASGPVGPTERWLDLKPGEPYRADLSSRWGAPGNLTVGLNATAYGGPFGLVVRPVGDGTGAYGRGTAFEEQVASPDKTGTFLLFARSQNEVLVKLTSPASGLRVDVEPVDRSPRSETVTLSGPEQEIDLLTAREDLVVEVSSQAAGTLELVDPEGRTREQIDAGGEGWALVEPVGHWRLVCSQACVGQVEVTVVGYEG